WGITNNICSLRDLYQERTDPAHPDCFLYDGRWDPAALRREEIRVRGAAAVVKTIRASRNGPIVDEVLPPPARGTGPVSLRWVGFEPCGWLTAMLGMNRARSCAELREAARPWHVPTFNVVFADDQGHIGYQCVGRIPIRTNWDRAYRPGWDPAHQWQGYIPFDDLPHVNDPPRGYVVTANNRTAPDDFPYPLSGTWSGGYRAWRIRNLLEELPRVCRDDCRRMQLDVYSGRCCAALPALLTVLEADDDPRIAQAVATLREWNGHVEATSAAAAIFNVFFTHWCLSVAQERFPHETAGFVAANVGGLALRLLLGDDLGWFQHRTRETAIRAAFLAALDDLAARFGPEPSAWQWGKLHVLLQKHFLSGRGDLGQLLDRSGLPLSGDGNTVNSSTPDASFGAWLGAGFRMVADLADPQAGLWWVEVGSVSGHPGSSHYDDQLLPWSEGKLHYTAVTTDGLDGPRLTLAHG
ncbi:MAG: penicillin acylase family protein, partial [Gemmataceae bacterium]|nr:penicillin acylase family protein [Gemmataceae bacterium]